ncbi:SUN domain-containing protein 2, partial [Tinamus guttatus]
QPDITPGQCWCFRGFSGQVVIKLPARIWPTAITVHHVSRADSPHGSSSSSTPKDITVSGLDEGGEATLLGTFSYDLGGEALQVSPLKNTRNQAFPYIQVSIQNNWGNTEYTCLYRVQVHG